MNVMIVRAKIKPETAEEVVAAAETMFAAIEKADPQGARYASLVLPDGVTFVALLAVDEGIENPLMAVPEFVEFEGNLRNWLAEPPTPEQLTVIGSYRFL
ncbi:hypothetical protein [Pseudofrankia sp. BMG5.36]|uniref:hypothetical protein n=1 Tax=Pseudofrankia sp. BMG5.36 TaxID=1834512 RepID=UPI0008D9EEE5|nr:hypothetical protein [Pseudofrankia sp. BMG5.36]OHV45558.1 hypothetical protein BCD48_22520 [Pseudofrankia sp. BMG5.36]